MELPERFTAETEFGKFDVRITNNEYISIGSRNSCVQIGYSVKTNTARLDWLGTEKGGCEKEDNPIRGPLTIKMTDLGFTILRDLIPSVNPFIQLTDSSTFVCILPNGQKIPMSKQKFNLLLFGKTFYQEAFGAVPMNDENKAHQVFVSARIDPSKKPPIFEFNHPDLNSLLDPIYNKTETWKDFFDELYNQFGYKKLCTLMYPWYLQTIGILTKHEVTSYWKIDITSRPRISYIISNASSGSKATRKNFTYNPFVFGGARPHIYEMSFKSLLKRHRFGQTTRRHRRSMV